jgi:DNA gyrase subunit A
MTDNNNNNNNSNDIDNTLDVADDAFAMIDFTDVPNVSFAKETLATSLEDEMEKSYLDYAMSVIIGRALPDARDGLKPVHRRVLFSMHELGNDFNKAYKKSARIVGDVIGKYHPHGDTAVYDTIVRMAQDFSLRYPLIDGQGNFGSVDGDSAAAMRYTEIRMTKIGHELLADIEKETVDFVPNYDGAQEEPSLLPARLPNLLINGSSGIAVGMATNIPPHNLKDTIDSCLALLENPEIDIDSLIEIIQAPDFPTAGIIYGLKGVYDGYRTGRGRVVMRATTHFEDLDKGKNPRQAIIIDALPYQVNKKNLLEKIAELVNEKRLEGISHIQDESDRTGMRVVIELKRNEVPEVVLNNLYKNTQLQDTFGMNMVALVGGQPKLMNLKDMLECFLEHRRAIITRRIRFELRKSLERMHVLEGLAVALNNVDELITMIKASPTANLAKQQITAQSWQLNDVVYDKVSQLKTFMKTLNMSAVLGLNQEELLSRNSTNASTDDKNSIFRTYVHSLQKSVTRDYQFSDTQTQEILQMRLQRLTGLEQDKILQEYQDVTQTIHGLLKLLSDGQEITSIIKEELTLLKSQYTEGRRSEIVLDATDLNTEDLITPQDRIITISHTGYIKAQALDEYKAQKRGGRGKQAAATKDEDFIEELFIANTHDTLLCFSNKGKVYWLKVYEVPIGARTGRGKPLVNLFPLKEGEKITAILPIKEFTENHYVFMATSLGTVKKTALINFKNRRTDGIIAVALDDNDFLIGAALTDGNKDIMLFSDYGKAVRFEESDVRPIGRTGRGVRGMSLGENHQVISLLVADNEEVSILTATENGYGKRTPITEYTRHARATKGMIAIQTSERNGKVVAATIVDEKDELMLIADNGVLIRTRVSEIRSMGRSTQGVTLIALEDDAKLTSIQRIIDLEELDENLVENVI